jgi:hypothetical protein
MRLIGEEARMTAMTDFILARIEEDEREAEDAHLADCDGFTRNRRLICKCRTPYHAKERLRYMRLMVETHLGEIGPPGRDAAGPDPVHCMLCGFEQPLASACLHLRATAMQWSDHPDYRREWDVVPSS